MHTYYIHTLFLVVLGVLVVYKEVRFTCTGVCTYSTDI